MTNPRPDKRRMPPQCISTEEVPSHIIGARAMACRDRDAHTAALAADIAWLLAEITRLRKTLMRSRLRAANLEAAIRAALGAHHDGETDPLAYLREEISPDTGGAHDA